MMDFKTFVKDIIDNKLNVYGVEVYENGILTHSYELYSATKTITSIAAGIAYDEGRIDLDETVLTYLPEDKVSKMSEDQYNTWKKITLRRLMTMSVADIPFAAEGDSWIDFALSCPISNPEEKVFNYSNINTYLVGVCLTKAIGSDLGAFIEDRIFKPLDIVNYEYARCPEGYFYGASRTKLSVHDLSKIGLLLYNGGEYKGNRIVSKEYVDMATSVQQMNREGGYGFFIWKYRNGFSINGSWGQKCYILPTEGIIVTYLSHFEDESHTLKKSMEKNILNVHELIIRSFVENTKNILQDNLVGIYLHGSAVMGCYNPDKSDLDFLVVVKESMMDDVKRTYMDMVVGLNAQTPGKGIEMSIVKREVCDPFIYPTPFELHFSQMHIKWYSENPDDYIRKMNGTDKDLAAHFKVIKARGKCLFGLSIDEVFGEVPEQYYMDSLWNDIEEATEEITDNTMYLTLNLARVYAWVKEKKVLSKKEGGEWGLKNLPDKYHSLLQDALKEYKGMEPKYDMDIALDYANDMLTKIQTEGKT
jgi:predicted nucleotidyltransferase